MDGQNFNQNENQYGYNPVNQGQYIPQNPVNQGQYIPQNPVNQGQYIPPNPVNYGNTNYAYGYVPQELPPYAEPDLKGIRKQISKIGLFFLLGSVCSKIVQYLFHLAIAFIDPELTGDPNLTLTLNVIALYFAGMPLIFLLTRKIKSNPPVKHKMKAWKFPILYSMCYSVGIISNIIGVVLVTIFTLVMGKSTSSAVANYTSTANIWLLILYVVIVAPIMEELVFRKLLIDKLRSCGPGVAIVLSGLMFGLFHGNVNQFLFAFPLGMCFAYVYIRTGKIQITILLHLVTNAMGSLAGFIILRSIDMDEYMRIVQRGKSTEMMAFMSKYGWVFLLLGIFVLLVFALVIMGIVFWIVNLVKKRIFLDRSARVIPKGKSFGIMFGNLGMILFILYWTGIILYTLIFM